MQNHAEAMRGLMESIRKIEENQLHPQLVKYMANNPGEVFGSKELAMAKLKQDAQDGSRFEWAIGRLPDGRFVTAFPRFINTWGLDTVAHGHSRDL
jgi:hypothetical protein